MWPLLWLLLGMLIVVQLFGGFPATKSIPYSEFQYLLEQGQVSRVTVSDNYIRATLREPLEDGSSEIRTLRVDDDLAATLREYGVTYEGTQDTGILTQALGWILPFLLLLGVWIFMFRRAAGGGGFGGLVNIGKSRAKIHMERDTNVTFDDVAGVDEAKDELQEIIRFLREPADYGRLGAHVPKGVLLVGAPGCGKTLLARAVAGEAGVIFFSINGSEFVEMFVGVGAARVRDLFEQARNKAPCIIFIDELDALGRARGISPISGGSDEKEQTLNQLLAELDGFDPRVGVVLLAATNRPEILDPALLRAGRFDRQILVDRPDKAGRAQILRVHLKKIRSGNDVDPQRIAELTVGFTGADLANLVNEAATVATRRVAEAVTMDDVTVAIERIVAGLEKKNRLLNLHEREIVAYHETGHALVAMALPGVEPVHKISIIPHGIGALGYTIQRPTEDRYLMTADELENKLTVLLGGRAAEFVVFRQASTGAADDLEKATEIARGMVMRYGMNEELGLPVYAEKTPRFLESAPTPSWNSRPYSEETAHEIDHAVKVLLDRAFKRASQILTHYRPELDRTAKILMEKETLTADELPAIGSEGVNEVAE